MCREYVQNNDILIVDTYIDRAMTGTNDMRPDFQRMLKTAQNGNGKWSLFTNWTGFFVTSLNR